MGYLRELVRTLLSPVGPFFFFFFCVVGCSCFGLDHLEGGRGY